MVFLRFMAVVIIPVLFSGTVSYSQEVADDHKEFTIDFKDPVSVVNAIFYAAKTKDTNILWILQDPGMQADKAIYDICTLVTKREMKKFCDFYKDGRIVGDVEYINNFARVKISGVNQEDTIYTVTLAKRYGNWFLMSLE